MFKNLKLSFESVFPVLLSLSIFFTGCQNSKSQPKDDPDFKVKEHIVQGYLGPNHLANLVYRRGSDGDKFVGWGRTPITEWPVGSASKRVVVESDSDHRYSNGGCAMDVDGDGVDEIITARGSMSNLSDATLMWFDETEGERYWQGYEIASIWPKGYTAPHDIEPYVKELSGDESFKAVLANKARNSVHMFVIPEDPVGDEWQHYEIGSFPTTNHSGMEIVDVNDDGNQDIVSGNFWIEAPDDPTDVPWEFHRFSNWDRGGTYRWGGMNKHGVADFDGDGTLEIVASEAEIPEARLSLFDRESADDAGQWKEIKLDSGLDAPHSLVVADLNNDQKPDFLVGEMTAGGWNFPMNPNPKIFAYINQGNLKFRKSVISEGWGVHELRLFPQPYNGGIMVYAADEIQPQKFNNMNTHVSYWLIGPE